MVEQVQSDERKVWDAVQMIVDRLMKLDVDARGHVLRTVQTHFGLDVVAPARQTAIPRGYSHASPDPRDPSFSDREQLPPKEFLFQKQPKTAVERVACLGYYLAHYCETPHFKTVDISKLNTRAAQIKFSNTADSVANAAKSGLLASAGKGLKQLSALGERYVDVLPDRQAAKEVLDSMRPRRNRTKRTSRKKK